MSDSDKVAAVCKLVNLSYKCANYPNSDSIDKRHTKAAEQVLALVLGRKPSADELAQVVA